MLLKLIDWICRLFSLLMVICLAAMVIMVFGNVVLRYGFNSGITVSEELSRWLFVWMTFLGAFVAMRNHMHMGTNMVVGRLSLNSRKVCFGLSRILMLGVCWLIVQGGWQQTVINRATTSAVMEAPMAILYVTAVLFAVLAAVVLLHELWQLLTGRMALIQLTDFDDEEDRPSGVSSSEKHDS